MMKKLLLLFCIFFSLTGLLKAQVGQNIDAEYYTQCLFDSVSPTQIVYFTRVHSLSMPGSFKDLKEDGTAYTVVGSIRTCNYQDVVKECWLKQQSVDYINYVYSADAAQETEDFWIVDWTYVEQKSVSSFATSQTPLINLGHVPLAYPYGNSQSEAERFDRDLSEWLDCMGICYKDDNPYNTEANATGVGSAYTSLRGLRVSVTVVGIEFVNMYYSRNPNDPAKYDMTRSGTKTTVSAVNCDLPFDLYRRTSNGSPAWGVNYKGVVEYPPFTGMLTKVSCDFPDNRRDDCNRPAGSNETWIAAIDTQICNYYISIPANENITGIWLRGVNVIGGTYEPDGGGVSGKDVQDLTDTLNDYILGRYGMGEFAINNIMGTTYGWRITAKWLNYTFDSVGTNVTKYYPSINGCANYRTYRVLRNEMGGIVSCVDECGKRCYLPENAIRVNPGQENTIYDCMNTNRFGTETITAGNTKTFDLSKYHYFSYSALAGSNSSNSVETKDRLNNTVTYTINTGFSESITAETACDYLKGSIKFTITSGGLVKVSYLW